MTESQNRTLTFVFSDIEGSTRLLAALGDAYTDLLLGQRGIISSAALAHGGHIFGTEGDALFAVFEEARGAVLAAADAQVALAATSWPQDATVRLRMGVHTGTVQAVGDDYVGLALHETARITAAGHGGQVLVSAATAALVREALPTGTGLRDVGEHRLKDLPTPVRIYQLEVAGQPADFPPLRTLEALGARLPTQVTTFVGREDVERAARLLEGTRLLTLTGPGGTGKTRLSIALAAEVAAGYPDGTWFVSLDAVTQPALVASEIAATLGLSGTLEAPIERIVGFLRDRRSLLVLDNMEQVLDSGADVARILRECPKVRVVATSRIPLRIYGEQEMPVPPLSLPARSTDVTASEAARSEAVRLFVERAMAARPDFMLDDADAPIVADIVRRLDGLPLAIELAAARLRILPLPALRERLASSLTVLVGGARDLPARQQTLRGAIDWSHELLDEPDRRLLARFSVFAGGADLAEAEETCGPARDLGRDVLDGLSSLAEQSLVRTVDPVSTDPRFGMLATIREYAAERLHDGGEDDRVHRRHADAYLTLAERAAPHLTGADAQEWNDRLEAEHDNLRAALDWMVAADEPALGLRMVDALWRFWQVRGHLNEAAERVDRVLALPSVGSQDPALRSRGEGAAGSIAYWRSQVPSAWRHYAEALRLAQESGEPLLVARAWYNAGFAPREDAVSQDVRLLEGRPFYERSLALFHELGDRLGIADSTWALSMSVAAGGDTARAIELARESIAIGHELSDPFRIGWGEHMLGLMFTITGRAAEATAHFRVALELFSRAGDIGGVALLLADFAIVAVESGDTARAWRLFGAADRLREQTGTEILLEDIEFAGFKVAREPGTDVERAAFEAGHALTTEEAVAEALAPGR